MRNLDITIISLDDSSRMVSQMVFNDIPFERALRDADCKVSSYSGELTPFLQMGREFDAIITPGNSFGHMTGGFDGALVNHFGPWLDELVRAHIEWTWGGELPVGNARLLPIEAHSEMDHLVYTPTMRVPMILPDLTDAAYVATRAAFQQIERYNKRSPATAIESILLPVMGRGTGNMSVEAVARQMQLAIVNSLEKIKIEDLFEEGMQLHRKITQK